LLSDDAREKRLEVFYGRQISSLMRKEASFKTVMEAVALAQDNRLSNFSIEFRLDDQGIYVPGRWTPTIGLSAREAPISGMSIALARSSYFSDPHTPSLSRL